MPMVKLVVKTLPWGAELWKPIDQTSLTTAQSFGAYDNEDASCWGLLQWKQWARKYKVSLQFYVMREEYLV